MLRKRKMAAIASAVVLATIYACYQWNERIAIIRAAQMGLCLRKDGATEAGCQGVDMPPISKAEIRDQTVHDGLRYIDVSWDHFRSYNIVIQYPDGEYKPDTEHRELLIFKDDN